eukprot:3834474-Rhodomonas_salina.1
MQDGKRCGDGELVSAVRYLPSCALPARCPVLMSGSLGASEDGKGLVAFLRNGKSKEQKKKSTSESQVPLPCSTQGPRDTMSGTDRAHRATRPLRQSHSPSLCVRYATSGTDTPSGATSKRTPRPSQP